MKKCSFLLLIVSALFFVSSEKSFSQWSILKADADSLITLGADYIYNLQFDNASAAFQKVQSIYPDHPAGFFLDAMVEWWKITLFRSTEKYDKVFLSKIQKVIDKSDKLLEQNPFDLTGLFFKGGALGYRGRFYVIRESWLKAAQDGKEAYDILIKCQQTAPNNHDIMLGTGIYNYFAAALPEQYPAVKPLMAFLPNGDKKIGLLQLEAASRNARYASMEAKVVLLQIYYQFEKNYYETIHLGEDLVKKYPNNPYFQRYLGRAYVSTGMRDKWEPLWRDILVRYINNQPGYDDMTAREALYYIGLALMQKGDYTMALKYFYKCDEACRKVDKDGPSGFMSATNINIGKIYDLQGKRDLAKKQYQKVLSWKDVSDSHREAQKYMNKPYGK
jgi:tetratricopeptide (TPR) repeat protein